MNQSTAGRTFPSSSHGEAVLPGSSVPGSGVSWSAVIAGATAAASLSLILLILGVGLGFSSISPWSSEGISATAFGAATIGWLTFTQLAASAVGGYLAGRLRTRWASLHMDEVYFRDTAHGFLAWGLATLVTAAVLTSAVGTVLSGGARAGAAVAATGAAAAAAPVATAASNAADGAERYYVDAIFRKETSAGAASDASGSAATAGSGGAGSARVAAAPSIAAATPIPAAEVARIYASALSTGSLPADDSRYVSQLVAEQTGLPQAEAQRRVTDSFNRLQAKTKQLEVQAKDAADKARKAAAYAALWFFVSLLAGAFVASFAATFGGRRRDLF